MIAALVFAIAAVVPTDQTVNVAKGTKLDLNNFAGDVVIKVWDRDAVRVEATHSDRESVDIKQADQVLTVRSRSIRGGPPRSLDYAVTVPKWMAVAIGGNYADVTMDGVGGDVTVDTTRGDIKVSGGSGFISLKSVQGEITLEKAKGRVEIRAVNEGIHIVDVSADLSAESTNGSIILDRVDSSNVDLYTVNGNISYDGPIKDKGLYRLTTHNGLIALPLPEKVNATITARTYNGSIRSTFPLPASDAANAERRNKRLTLTLGNGGAHVELESFGGSISLRRPGEARPETERKRREKDKDIGRIGVGVGAGVGAGVGRGVGAGVGRGVGIGIGRGGDVDSDAIAAEVARAMAEAQPEIDRAIAEAQPEISRALDDAMRQAGPEIDRAISAAMAAASDIAASFGDLRIAPMPNVVPMPGPNPMPMPMPRIVPAPRR